jgi:hypothetical protein
MGIGPEGFGGCKHKDFAEAFLLWTKSEGMKDAKLIPKGCYAAIRPLAFTHAIVVGRDRGLRVTQRPLVLQGLRLALRPP